MKGQRISVTRIIVIAAVILLIGGTECNDPSWLEPLKDQGLQVGFQILAGCFFVVAIVFLFATLRPKK